MRSFNLEEHELSVEQVHRNLALTPINSMEAQLSASNQSPEDCAL